MDLPVFNWYSIYASSKKALRILLPLTYKPLAYMGFNPVFILYNIKMRKITQQASQALKNGQHFNLSNTLVSFEHGVWGMELHGNHIASYNKENKKLLVRDAGRKTNTTKERLNGILIAFGLPTIYQKNFEWFIGDEKRNGEKIFEL